jgi:cytochrome c peroxidase
MHDGRFNTLDEVIEHYNSGVKSSSTLDPIMTKPGKETGLHLSNFDKYCLKQFLLTLTDSSVITNINYSKTP